MLTDAFLSVGVLLASVASATPTIAPRLSSSLQQITNFGPNPRNVGFHIYVPAKLQARPPILVVPHWCHGTAQAAFNGRPYAQLGDQYGFISIYPNSSNTADNCWDVSSPQTLSHNGGGDSQGIVSMVKWTLQKYHGDPDRVFSSGTSSGAMMTNVLMGSYPDVFTAGAVWAGVAFGCFAADGYGVWSDACATGQIIKSGPEWASEVKAAYPGYNRYRPKLIVFHGENDTTLYPQNFQEEIKEWTSVFGYSATPRSVQANTPKIGWTKQIYGPKFEATHLANTTHDIPEDGNLVVNTFQLNCDSKQTRCYSRRS